MPGPTHPDLLRAQRAILRGLSALGRRAPTFTNLTPDIASLSDREAKRARDELRIRAHIEILDHGRDLLSTAADLERKAAIARLSGIEALRHASPGESWAQIGERLGMSAQGAHKRFREVDEPEPLADDVDEHAQGEQLHHDLALDGVGQ